VLTTTFPTWKAWGALHPIFPSGPETLTIAAPAKLNLFLVILGKRPDGYHDLETLMVAIDLYDTLEVCPRADGKLDLLCDPPGLPTGPENLVYKAADQIRQQAQQPGLGASMRLTKRVPTQAGLAGGSSDAAAALVALNHVWGLNLSKSSLASVASVLPRNRPGGYSMSLLFAHRWDWARRMCTAASPSQPPRPMELPLGWRSELVTRRPSVGPCSTASSRQHSILPRL
jgi:4-diphosphocytidyl-2-C-methyl-D-erythritol kinase